MDSVTICNLALAKCGEQRIALLTEKSKNAVLCQLHFDQARREVIQAHPWNCAIARAELAEDSVVPAFEYEHQFVIPTDCLRIIRMEDPTSVFRVEGRRLLTNDTQCKIVYIRDVTDMNSLAPLLVKAIYLQLAIVLSYNLTEARTQTDALLEELKQVLVEARFSDAMEGTPEQVEYSEWLESRIAGTSIYRGEYPFRNIEAGTP